MVFLECDKKTYFIAPPSMKKVMHGDKIKATIEKQGDKEQAEPESLIEPMLTRFIAKVRFNKDKKIASFSGASKYQPTHWRTTS